MRKKNFKEYTTRVHGNNINLMERHETSGQPKLSFGKRPAKGHEMNKTNLFQRKLLLRLTSIIQSMEEKTFG